MELPDGVAALISDLRGLGFQVVEIDENPARSSRLIELAASPKRRGVTGVQVVEDRGLWGVEVRIRSAVP